VSSRRKINDRQPSVTQPQAPIDVGALSIRPTMDDGIGHLLDNQWRDRLTVPIENTN
jgi:hypothetical protein